MKFLCINPDLFAQGNRQIIPHIYELYRKIKPKQIYVGQTKETLEEFEDFLKYCRKYETEIIKNDIIFDEDSNKEWDINKEQLLQAFSILSNNDTLVIIGDTEQEHLQIIYYNFKIPLKLSKQSIDDFIDTVDHVAVVVKKKILN